MNSARLFSVLPIDLAFVTLWWVLLWFSRRRDNRRLRNGLLFLLLISSVTGALIYLTSLIPGSTFIPGLDRPEMLLGSLLFPIMAFMPFLLMFNGVVLIRREGRRLSNLLCLAAGLGLIITPITAIFLVATLNVWAMLLAMLMFCACCYLGTFLLIFLAQTVVQRIWGGRRAVPHPDVIVVHGAGLINGEVGPLLGSRIKGAIDAWHDEEALRPGVPLLVMSGGQGPDEPVSEARAMADYAIAHGIPAERILLEDRSTTTRTNIAYTRDLLAEIGMENPQVLLVTSSFHAVRTAILASDMGVPWAVAPARTAWFYIVNAWLREYIAVLTYRRKPALICAIIAGLLSMMYALVIVSSGELGGAG